MLSIAYTLRFALINLSKTTNIKAFKNSIPLTSEQDNIKTLINILEIFIEPIEALQTQKYPTLGLSLLYISRIRDFLLDLLKD